MTPPAFSRRPVVLLSAAAFCSAATMRVADPLLPQIAHEFAVTPGEASVVATAFSLAYGLCQIVYGPLGDRYGKYLLIAIATTVSALAVAATAAADSLLLLGLLRLAAGAAAAAVIPLSMAFIGDMVAYEARQTVLARFLSGQILGLVFGQAAGGIIIELADWRAAFLVLGAAFAAVALLLWLELASPRVTDRRAAARRGLGRVVGQYAALLGAPHSRAVVAAVFVEGFFFFGGFAYVGAFIRHEFRVGYATVGLLLGCFGLGGLAYALSVRRLVAALGERGMVRGGGILLVSCFTALTLAPDWPALAPVIATLGFGFYMLHNTLQTNATQMAPEARGAAVSLFAACFFLGQAAGVALIGEVVDRAGFRAAFVVPGLSLAILGFWFGLRAGRHSG